MSTLKSPAFQFYPKDWIADARVCELSLEEEGAYIRLLNHCWLEGSVPADPARCARIIGKGCSVETATTVQRLFNVCSTDTERLTHKRLDEEREKQKVRREQAAEAGRRSGEKRRNTANSAQTETNDRSTDVQRKPNTSSSSSSSSSVLNTHPPAVDVHPEEIMIPKNVDNARCRHLMGKLFDAMNERRSKRGEYNVDDLAMQANWDVAGQLGPEKLELVIPHAIGKDWKMLMIPNWVNGAAASKPTDDIGYTKAEEILWAQVAASCKDESSNGQKRRDAFDTITKKVMQSIGGSAAVRELRLGEKPELEMKRRFILARRNEEQKQMLEESTA